ncbi:MAG TPA: YciI family protein [Acidiferrobacter sp.]|nr:YciI family protein [Acidiferrobacter sp.]
MLYMIVGQVRPDSAARREAARPDHLQRLQTLLDQGRLVLAGPCPAIDSPDPGLAGYSAGLIVAEFSSLTEATAWAHNDPYVYANVYQDIVVRPFRQALP